MERECLWGDDGGFEPRVIGPDEVNGQCAIGVGVGMRRAWRHGGHAVAGAIQWRADAFDVDKLMIANGIRPSNVQNLLGKIELPLGILHPIGKEIALVSRQSVRGGQMHDDGESWHGKGDVRGEDEEEDDKISGNDPFFHDVFWGGQVKYGAKTAGNVLEYWRHERLCVTGYHF